MVAVDAKTGAYKWHFQSQRHGYHDMDNTQPPSVGEAVVNGVTKKTIYYGSKASVTFILDRVTGKPVNNVVERVVAPDSRQSDPGPHQPHPAAGSWVTDCIVYETLGTNNIPGNPYRRCRTTTAIKFPSASPTAPCLWCTRRELSRRRQAVRDDTGGLSRQQRRASDQQQRRWNHRSSPPGLPVGPALGSAAAVDDDAERR
jgi:hypothetical protein